MAHGSLGLTGPEASPPFMSLADQPTQPPLPDPNPPFMSPEEISNFFLMYGIFFLVMIFAIYLSTCFRAYQEKKKASLFVETHDCSEEGALETTHGPSAQLPGETVTEQFLKRSTEIPKHVALVNAQAGGLRCEILYEEFASKVRHLAKMLSSFGVSNQDIVALVLDRGVHQVATVYATMLCAAAWVPVDPAVPEHRLREVLQDSSPALMVHQDDAIGRQVARWSEALGVCAVVALPDASDLKGKAGAETKGYTIGSAKLGQCALVIYTSGTTGKPKGIMYSHAMLNHGAHAIADLMEMSHESIAFLKTPYIWAVVEWELFPALVCGGRLIVGSATAHKDPQYMAQTILAEQVTSLIMAPDVLDLLLDIHEQGSQLRSLKHVISVGAALPVTLANRFARMRRLSSKLHNVYGASESSCTVWTVPQGGVNVGSWSTRAPVGTPQMGCSVWILDEDLKRVPSGATGELCFGGQLAMGYLKMPELTAQKFVTHSELGPIYRTGDLARWRAGVLEICGRRDRQVKIRGVRVEPEEVESALKSFPKSSNGTGSAPEELPASLAKPLLDLEAVSPDGANTCKALTHVGCVATTGPSPELVAFVSPMLSEAELERLKKHAATMLPPYYLPKYVLSMPELPLLANGKVNLQALVDEANKYVETCSSETVVTDSLGRMRNMSRAAILETQVIHRVYAYWMFCVVTGHWFLCGLFTEYCLVLKIPGVVPPWVELFMRQFGQDANMFGYVFCGAFQDSRMPPGETKLRLLGFTDLILFLVYLFMAFPLPQMVGEIFAAEEFCIGNFWPDPICSGSRWYLHMVVCSHCCVALCQRLGMPGWLHVLGQVAINLFGPALWFDPCARDIPLWGKWVGSWVFPSITKFGNVGKACPIMNSHTQFYIMFYVIAFYYSRPAMMLITNTVNRLGCNSAAWAGAAWAVASMLAAWQAQFHYDTMTPLDIGLYTIQVVLQVLAMAWFPFDLKWLGNTTLGTYVIHYALGSLGALILHIGMISLPPMQAVPQLLFCFAVPIAFNSTVGPLFHYLLLSPTFIVRRVRAVLRTRRGMVSMERLK